MAIINVFDTTEEAEKAKIPNPHYVESAKKIIDALEVSETPWRNAAFLPANGISGNPYHALNAVSLMSGGYEDPRWLTYNQISSVGGTVRKGEHGTKVQFWSNAKWQDKVDENGAPVIGADGKPEQEPIELEKPVASYTVVFNASQCENLPAFEPPTIPDVQERIERLVKSTGVNYAEDAKDNRGHYDFKTDTIHVPPTNGISTESHKNEVLYQLAKSTAHKSRNDRRTGVAGSVDQAMEELRVDLAATMLSQTLGIKQTRDISPTVAKTWQTFLSDHPTAIVFIAKDAENAVKHVLNCEKELLQMQNETAPKTPAPTITKEERIYLRTTRDDNDAMKALGAKFDGEKKSWYVPENAANKDEFLRWHNVETALKTGKEEGRTYLNIKKDNADDKEAAKALGAKFDAGAFKWYAPKDADLSQFEKWSKPEPTAALDLREQASKKLAEIGLVCQPNELVMDDKSHRCAATGDKQNEQSGFYVIHPDGFANLFAQNNRTKEVVKEKFAGVHVSHREMQAIKAEASAKIATQEKELVAQHDAAAKTCVEKIAGMIELPNAKDFRENNEVIILPDGNKVGAPAYFQEKKIRVHKGVFISDKSENVHVPLSDIKGEIRSICHIKPDGTKGYEKGSQKTGNFHVIDGAKLTDAKAIIISEGYATAASIKEAVGDNAVSVMVGDSGNIKPVVENIKEAFPDKALVIACDDDQHIANNPGKKHAEEAARLVNAVVATPYFSDETRAEAKAAGVEHLSDFNDMEKFNSGYSPKDILLEAVDQALTQLNTKDRAETQELEKEKVQETPKEKIQEREPKTKSQGMSR